MNIAIIGAGFSGCYLYNKLINKNYNITIFEKSRGTGGRLSTKYINDKFCDHGTPYFKTFSKDFYSFCLKNYKNSLLKNKNIEFFPTNGINKVCSSLIDKSHLKTNTKIISCKKENDKWQLKDDKNILYKDFDFLFITIPAPQVLDLEMNLSQETQKLLKEVKYTSISTLILYGYEELIINEKLYNSKEFKSIINNSLKYNYKDFYSYVFHSNENYVKEEQTYDKEKLCSKMYEYIQDKEKLPKNIEKIFHLWKYALVEKSINKDSIYDKEEKLGICGDYFKHKNLESSFFSAKSIIDKVLLIESKRIN